MDELDRGQALLIDMRVTVEVELDDGAVKTVDAVDHQVWLHSSQHPPAVAWLVADLSGKDFPLLAERLQDAGADIGASDLEEMHVGVELADDLLAALRPEAARHARLPDPAARPGIETKPE